MDAVAGFVDRGEDDLGEEALLVGEVLVDGLLRDRGERGDLVHARAEIALAQEHRGGRVEDRRALACRPFVHDRGAYWTVQYPAQYRTVQYQSGGLR